MNIDVDDVERQSSEVSKIRNSNILHKNLILFTFMSVFILR